MPFPFTRMARSGTGHGMCHNWWTKVCVCVCVRERESVFVWERECVFLCERMCVHECQYLWLPEPWDRSQPLAMLYFKPWCTAIPNWSVKSRIVMALSRQCCFYWLVIFVVVLIFRGWQGYKMGQNERTLASMCGVSWMALCESLAMKTLIC